MFTTNYITRELGAIVRAFVHGKSPGQVERVLLATLREGHHLGADAHAWLEPRSIEHGHACVYTSTRAAIIVTVDGEVSTEFAKHAYASAEELLDALNEDIGNFSWTSNIDLDTLRYPVTIVYDAPLPTDVKLECHSAGSKSIATSDDTFWLRQS